MEKKVMNLQFENVTDADKEVIFNNIVAFSRDMRTELNTRLEKIEESIEKYKQVLTNLKKIEAESRELCASLEKKNKRLISEIEENKNQILENLGVF